MRTGGRTWKRLAASACCLLGASCAPDPLPLASSGTGRDAAITPTTTDGTDPLAHPADAMAMIDLAPPASPRDASSGVDLATSIGPPPLYVGDGSLTGFCDFRDAFTDLPAPTDPDIGKGYVKRNVDAVAAYGDVQTVCTSDVYTQLLADYCASGQTLPVQAEVAIFFTSGNYLSMTGCSHELGCNPVSCP